MQKYRFFIFSLIVAVCVHMTFAVPTQVPNEKIDKNYILCTTQNCLHAASEISANLNRTVKPCDNFYQFACGGWVKNHPVSESNPITGTMLVMGKKTKRQIAKILTDTFKSGDTLSLEKARKLFAMCMNKRERKRVGSSTFREFIQGNGGWPIIVPFMQWDNSTTWQQNSDIIQDNMFDNNLFNILVAVDNKQSNRHVIIIMEPDSFVPREVMLEIAQDSEKKKIYKSYIEDVARIFIKDTGAPVENQTLTKDAHDIAEFEFALARIKMSYEDSRDIDKVYNEFTIEDFQKEYDAKCSTPRSKIDWFLVFRKIFTPLGITIEPSEKIVVQAYNFLMQLPPLLEQTSDRVIVNYMQWITIKYMLEFSSPPMQKINSKMHKKFLSESSNIPRWKVCVENPNLDAAVSHGYSKKFVKHENVEDVNNIINDIKDVVHAQILKSSWMDEATKKVSLDKLAYMRNQISTPEWYSNEAIDKYYDGLIITNEYLESIARVLRFTYRKMLRKLRIPVDKNEWGVEPVEAEAFYNPSGNTIIMTAAILTDPLYDGKHPAFMNYGSTGFVIGHEVNHGFDNLGRKYDKNGNSVLWWTQETIDRYENLTQCFVDQYNNYTVPGLNNVYEKGALALGENIADSAAVTAAYGAYKNRKVRLNLSDVRLPGLEEYSDEQLLFMSMAHTLCANLTPEKLELLLLQEHSTPESRVRGSFSNSYEFSTVYGCPIGKGMNPQEKCILWQYDNQ